MWAMRGLTAAEITHQTKLPRSTVKYHLKRFKETGSWSRREYPIRVKTLTPFADCIRKHLKLHPHASATELHELLATKFQLMVSVRTVQRYLKTAIREQKSRDENSEEDSDTSATEELSIASGTDQTASPKPRSRERLRSVPISTPVRNEGASNVEKSEPPPPPQSLQPSVASSPASTSQTPLMNASNLPSMPCSLISPYPMMLPSWQEPQNSPNMPSFSGFSPLTMQASLPALSLGFYPMYHQFAPAVSLDNSGSPYSTTQFSALAQSRAPTPSSATPPSSAKLDPSLEALVNAALVSE